MDETKGTAQDTSPKEGDSSGSAGGSTSQEATFTKAQVDKAVSDALAKAGRDAKSFEAKEKAIKEAKEKVEAFERQQEEAETEKNRDNPDGLKLITARRDLKKAQDALKQEREALEADKAAHAEKLTRAQELELEVTVWKAAQAKGVDAEVLKEKCLRFKVTAEDDINDLADTLAAGSKPKTADTHFDSNKGSGGSKDFSTVRFEPGAPSGKDMISKGLDKK